MTFDDFLKQAAEDCVNGSTDDTWRCVHCEKLMRSRFHKARHEQDCGERD